MEAPDVLDLLDELEAEGIRCWLDGGWGVDGLLGEETRPHSDLDLVVVRPALPAVRRVLEGRGFSVLRDWLPMTVAWRDASGREVDLHPIDETPDGGGDQVLDDGTTWHYGPPTTGSIDGRPVPCATAAEQIAMHQGYELRPVDLADVRRLAERFDLPLPRGFG